MNREQAAEALLRGLRVRHESWHVDGWIGAQRNLTVIDNHGNIIEWKSFRWPDGWSIVSPAPTASPDIEARLAAVEADMSQVRQILHIPNAETKAALEEAEAMTAQRHLSAESLTGAMGDDEIAEAAHEDSRLLGGVFWSDLTEEQRTRQVEAVAYVRSLMLDEMLAKREQAAAAGMAVYNKTRLTLHANPGEALHAAIDHILKAVRK